jgi:hypothetical protein
MHDVEPHLYSTVIREMIRHENDVTNHRIMWLLIVQGLIANAYVGAGHDNQKIGSMLAPVGILVALSAFVILYKSYQARGYLQFLGNEAKKGTLSEANLPLSGWPRKRIKGWREKVWICPWLGEASELLEPYFFLPSLLTLSWLFVLLRFWCHFDAAILLGLAAILVVLLFSLLCIAWVWWQTRNEQEQ